MSENKVAAAILTAISAFLAGGGSNYATNGDPIKVLALYKGFLIGVETGDMPELAPHLRKQ